MWPDGYITYSLFGHLQQWTFAQYHKNGQSRLIFFQIWKKHSKKLPKIIKCSPNWRNFAKSGHTAHVCAVLKMSVCLLVGWLTGPHQTNFEVNFDRKSFHAKSWRGMKFSAETVETREESTLLVLGKTSLDSARGKEIIIQTKIWWRNNSWLLIFNFYSHASLGKTKDSPKDPPRFNVVQYN